MNVFFFFTACAVLDIPMQYFILEGLMIEFGQNDYTIQHIPQEELQRLIIELGYLEWEIDDRHVLIAEMAG